MRILSQEKLGIIDLTYENIGISIMDKTSIIAYPAAGSLDDWFWQLAIYSTEVKARKAMEMLHEAYCGVIYLKHADYEVDNIDLAQELEEKIKEEMSKPHFLEATPKNPVVECKVFQFPSDDELEV